MATDEITWAPRVGSSGDGVYNIPGATGLDGSKDGGAPTRVKAGSAGFSTTPTITQLNSSSDMNQLLGLINRRIRNHNASYGTSYATLPYVTTGQRALNVLAAAKAAIDWLRSVERYDPFPWSADWAAANFRFNGRLMAEMRKALAIGVVTSTAGDYLSFTERFALTKYPIYYEGGVGNGAYYFHEWEWDSYNRYYIDYGYGYYTSNSPRAYWERSFYRLSLGTSGYWFYVYRGISSSVTAPANRNCFLRIVGRIFGGTDCYLITNAGNLASTSWFNYSSNWIYSPPVAIGSYYDMDELIPIGRSSSTRSIRVFYKCTNENGESLPADGGPWSGGSPVLPQLGVLVDY